MVLFMTDDAFHYAGEGQASRCDIYIVSGASGGGEGACNFGVCTGAIGIQINFEKTSIKWKVLNIYVTKYNNVTSWRQGKCTRKYITICIPMALELHAPSLPSAGVALDLTLPSLISPLQHHRLCKNLTA